MKYVLQRIGAMLLTLFMVMSLSFMVIRLMPMSLFENPEVPKEIQEKLEDKFHLNDPLPVQYFYFMEGIVTGIPFRFGGNVLNDNFNTNLPAEAVVEIPCIADANGIHGEFVGRLPTQCAALNTTNINPQLLTIEAALTRKKETVYQAALLDPHTSAELSIDDTIRLCDALFEAHGDMIPEYN